MVGNVIGNNVTSYMYLNLMQLYNKSNKEAIRYSSVKLLVANIYI